MDKYFNELNNTLFSLLTEDEILKNSMWGENSQFIRINNSKIRQTGIVNDLSYSMTLISNKRQVSHSLTITGVLDTDKAKLETILNKLREDITQVPEDPFIVYPESTKSSEEKHKGSLLHVEDAVKMVISGGIVTPPGRRPPSERQQPRVSAGTYEDLDILREQNKVPILVSKVKDKKTPK